MFLTTVLRSVVLYLRCAHRCSYLLVWAHVFHE